MTLNNRHFVPSAIVARVCRELCPIHDGEGNDVPKQDGHWEEEELYRGLRLRGEEGDWVRHYLRVADHALFGRRPVPRVVVVDDEWESPRRKSFLLTKPAA